MIQQIKQSTVKCLHDTDGSNKFFFLNLKEKERGARCKVHVYDGGQLLCNK